MNMKKTSLKQISRLKMKKTKQNLQKTQKSFHKKSSLKAMCTVWACINLHHLIINHSLNYKLRTFDKSERNPSNLWPFVHLAEVRNKCSPGWDGSLVTFIYLFIHLLNSELTVSFIEGINLNNHNLKQLM